MAAATLRPVAPGLEAFPVEENLRFSKGPGQVGMQGERCVLGVAATVADEDFASHS